MSKLNFSLSDQECVNNRKRKIKVSEWQDKKRKTLKDSGQPYINNRGKGIQIEGKKTPSDVSNFLCTI